MNQSALQGLVLIEGSATYEKIISSTLEMEPEEALTRIYNFLKIFPEFARAHYELAVRYHHAGTVLKALAHYEKAHKLEPSNIIFRKKLADFYFVELEWTDDAIQTYLDILKNNPFDVEALNTLGTMNAGIGRFEQARLYFTRTLQLDAANSQALQALQQLEGELPVPPPAQKSTPEPQHIPTPVLHVEEAKDSLRPEEVNVQKNIYNLQHTSCSDSKEELQHYTNILNSNPRDLGALKAISRIHLESGQSDNARSYLETILQIAPWDGEASTALDAMAEVEMDQPEPAGMYRSADEAYAAALLLTRDDRVSEAHSMLEELVHSYPDHALGNNDLGVLRHQLGDVDGARQAYERAVELLPDNDIFRKNLADLYFVELGMTDEAIQIYLDLFRHQPSDQETLAALGQICTAVGLSEEAKIFYHKAVEIEPWNTEVRNSIRQSG